MSADPFGRVLTEIRDDPSVAAITTRIRNGDAMGRTVNAAGVETDAGDSRGPGKYVPFVVLTRLPGGFRLKRAPVQEVRMLAKCYAATAQLAAVLAGAVGDAVHARGHRITPAGVAIFGSFDEGTGGATNDPDTHQPCEYVFITVGALSETLPIG